MGWWCNVMVSDWKFQDISRFDSRHQQKINPDDLSHTDESLKD